MIALSNCRETNSYAIVTTSKPKALWSINISGEKRKEKGIGICQLISRINAKPLASALGQQGRNTERVPGQTICQTQNQVPH